MADEEIRDVTAERDVTEATIDHELNEAEAPMVSETAEDLTEPPIEFFSMDGKIYLADPTVIDWQETGKPESVANIKGNILHVKSYLQELMFSRVDSALATEEAAKIAAENRALIAKEAMDLIVPRLTTFGFAPEFTVTYPGIEGEYLAALYCMDYIEVMTKILCECRVRYKEDVTE